MTSFEIYKKTFRFTLMKILSGLVGILLIVGLPALAFAVTGSAQDDTRIIVCVCAFVAACIVVGLLSHFIGYAFRAGQIAVAAEAISTGALPEDPWAAGKAAVKNRFGTVAVFFAIEKIINAIVHQLTNAVTKVTEGISAKSNNDTVKTIGSVINLIISAMLKFMCSCCMAWVFIHPETNPWRSACDGAIVYFKNWKDLLKNTAKVLLIGLLSLVILGGALFGLSHAVLGKTTFMNEMTVSLTDYIAEDAKSDSDDPDLTADEWALIFEAVPALILWGIIHSALIDPYIMISVMNRYIKAGLANPPARDVDTRLAGMSRGYRKAIESARA